MQQVCGRREMHAGFWWRNLEERDNFKDLVIGRRVTFYWIL
jgi:hypothetical protein